MDDLFRQRDELLEKIRALAQTYESPDKATNANQIVELNVAQAKLLVQKDALQTQIAALDAEYRTLDENIAEFFSAAVPKILQAIKNQRWYFFANNDKILLDRDTALVWANLDKFPHSKNGNRYSSSNNYAEVRELLAQKNLERWGGYGDWKIPTPHELWQMIESKTFPFQSGNVWRIKGFSYWCVDYNGGLAGKDLDDYGATTDIADYDAHVLPCSHALVPPKFSATPQEILNIFIQNNLVPKFKDAAVNELYGKIFGATAALIEVERQIAALQAAPIKLTATFNYRQVLAKFDTAAIAKSPIKYFDAVLTLTDELLDSLSRYEAAQSETIAAYLQIALKLNAKFNDNPNLTPEENSLLAERQKFLTRRLELRTDEPKRKILSVKAQAKNFFARLEIVNEDDNSIRELAALYAEPRVDFELLVENLSRIIVDTQRRVDFFAALKNVVAFIVKAHGAWSDDYKSFRTSLREELTAACRNESIADEIFGAWYDDWRATRFLIEQRILPLAEFALKGNLSDGVELVLNALRGYREAVDEFYLHERKNIYQKFAFVPGGDLQEKFETESILYRLAEKFQRDLQEIIFARDKSEERIFLLKWSEPLLNLPLDELSNFIRDRKLEAISQETLTQFAELRRPNFAQYLSDAQAYGVAIQRREAEYTALIFRMRQALNQR